MLNFYKYNNNDTRNKTGTYFLLLLIYWNIF